MISIVKIQEYSELVENRHKISYEIDRMYDGLLFKLNHNSSIDEQLERIEIKTKELEQLDFCIKNYDFS